MKDSVNIMAIKAGGKYEEGAKEKKYSLISKHLLWENIWNKWKPVCLSHLLQVTPYQKRITPGMQCQLKGKDDTLFKDGDPQKPHPIWLAHI